MGDYFGYGDAHISGLGFRLAGLRPVTNTFSKSVLLDELDEETEEELKRKKRRITELQDIDVEEISLVDRPATRQKFTIIKGDDKEMDNKCEWSSVQRCVFGFCDDDLDMLEDNYEIEKSSPDDKFPSLTRQFNLNRARIERTYEEYELESRLV